MRLPSSVVAAAVAALTLPTAASAQQWDASLLSSPTYQPRVETFATDSKGAGFGVMVAVRPLGAVKGLRARVGVADGVGSGLYEGSVTIEPRTLAVMGGVDYTHPLAPDDASRLKVSLVAGVGAGYNGNTLVRAPLGVTVGYDGGWIRPYVTPRLTLEHNSGSIPRSDDPSGFRWRNGFDNGRAIDWGADVRLPIGGALRASITTGDTRSFAFGFSF